jgi:predicted GNAT family N-acyltransferase
MDNCRECHGDGRPCALCELRAKHQESAEAWLGRVLVAEKERDEARKLAREYFEFVRGRWKGYEVTLRERYPWITEGE